MTAVTITPACWDIIHALAAWNLEVNGDDDHQVCMRACVKPTEEVGEWDEATTPEEIIAELCDVALTPLVALTADWTNFPAAYFESARRFPNKSIVQANGKISEVYIGYRGQNYRKGVTHTAADVADALCVLARSAFALLEENTSDPSAIFQLHLVKVAARVNLSVKEVHR